MIITNSEFYPSHFSILDIFLAPSRPNAYAKEMMTVQNPLRSYRRQAGLTLEQLARLVSTTAAQISKLEKGERRLTVDWMARLAPPLGIQMADLLSPVPPSPPSKEPPLNALLPGGDASFAGFPISGEPRDFIPVRSAGRGGIEQEMFLQDGPIDYIRRPPSLAQVRDAYAIYVVGDSMQPRFRPGQLLHVNPFKPPQSGSGVVVTKASGAVLIKEFVRQDAHSVYLRQYNPADTFFYNIDEISAVHMVVGLQEP